jgi:hypothetical protein
VKSPVLFPCWLTVASVLTLSLPWAAAQPAGLPAAHAPSEKAASGLKVSSDGRFLQTTDGKPFFWLADTAWELFHRLNREEADHYLTTRASQGYTVIQAVALAEMDGLGTPNAYGHLPLEERDPARPAEQEGAENDYWDHVDYIVSQAGTLGLTIGFLPTWGDKWHGDKKGLEIFTPENARRYGEWLGKRYREDRIVWILGGDRMVESDQHKAVIRAMAAGLKAGDGGRHLITFHPRGGAGSAEVFHEELWLDFNLRQNGHQTSYQPTYAKTRVDYDRQPVKPVIDGEPVYEDHPVDFKAGQFGHSTANDVRRPLYWDLFSGACGHTYGHHSIWQFWQENREPKNSPLLDWRLALQQSGAKHMLFGKLLILSRPVAGRVPDDSLIVDGAVKTAVPGAGRYQFCATRGAGGKYAFIYAPVGREFKVRMDRINGPLVRAWWYDPRTGKTLQAGEFPNTGERAFIPPDPNEDRDWVLVLDDAAAGFPAPGTP